MTKEISSLQHPLVKHFVHLRQNNDYRYEHKSVVIEGSKMIAEIADAHPIKNLIVCDQSLIPENVNAKEVLIVDAAVMKKISGMHTPEGIIAEVELPTFSTLEQAKHIIALDQVNDPGNLGAILRTALAFGWDGAFLIGDGCDPYNEKALRAARGATFRLPLRRGSWLEFNALMAQLKITPFAADLKGEEVGKLAAHERCALVLGNEAHGPSPEAMNQCKKITLPMSGKMESLNVAVAGGILMYLLRQGR